MSQSNITIIYNKEVIDTLIKQYQVLEKNQQITVYRIQLESSESPAKISNIKKKYLNLFPTETVEEIFEPPYFKAITGVYLDKKNAEKKIHEIRKKFKSSFILQENIKMEIFKKTKGPF